MRGGFTAVEGDGGHAQVCAPHGRVLTFYTPTLKAGRPEEKWGKVKSKLVRWHGLREDNNGAPFPSETSGANGLSDLVRRGGAVCDRVVS